MKSSENQVFNKHERGNEKEVTIKHFVRIRMQSIAYHYSTRRNFLFNYVSIRVVLIIWNLILDQEK